MGDTWIDNLKIQGSKERLLKEVDSILWDIRKSCEGFLSSDLSKVKSCIEYVSARLEELEALRTELQLFEIP